ncbi:MAG: hypothetical protein PHD04_04090 [Candidatus Pacebacteria bacterium]|nr:hypothetical protein [Candidatus Paceibacterota bacterium]
MSKPVVFSLLAMLCYAVVNVLFEQKFAKFNNLTLMCVYLVPMLLVGVVGRSMTSTSDPSFDFPTGMSLAILIALGFIYAAADYFYIGAYTSGGELLTVSSIVVMYPIVSSLIKFVLTQGLPNAWQVSGYVLAVGAMLLVAKGSTSAT